MFRQKKGGCLQSCESSRSVDYSTAGKTAVWVSPQKTDPKESSLRDDPQLPDPGTCAKAPIPVQALQSPHARKPHLFVKHVHNETEFDTDK